MTSQNEEHIGKILARVKGQLNSIAEVEGPIKAVAHLENAAIIIFENGSRYLQRFVSKSTEAPVTLDQP